MLYQQHISNGRIKIVSRRRRRSTAEGLRGHQPWKPIGGGRFQIADIATEERKTRAAAVPSFSPERFCKNASQIKWDLVPRRRHRRRRRRRLMARIQFKTAGDVAAVWPSCWTTSGFQILSGNHAISRDFKTAPKTVV